MLTAADIMGILNDPKNKKVLEEAAQKSGVSSSFAISKERMREIAQDLIDQLYKAGREVTKTSGHSLFREGTFGGGTFRVQVYQSKGMVRILCDGEDLKRPSLSKVSGKGQKIMGYTGDGVYDIVGLFTQGYRASRFTYGLWESAGRMTATHSLGGSPGLKPNAFIDDVMEAFKAKYAGEVTDVIYPSLWHSRI